MTKSVPNRFASLICIFAFALVIGLPAGAAEPVNPFLQPGQWYKAALHVHTTTSDGDVPVAERLQQYREKGYDVVALTDHWSTNPIDGFSDESFLVINGMEMHPEGNHFVCIHLPEGFQIPKDMKPQPAIDSVNAAGGVVFYAHPYWLGHTIENMRSVTGYVGLEVYNAVCEIGPGKGYADIHWDQLLGAGCHLSAIATDDVHNSKNIDLAWTMVKAPELTAPAIVAALKSGAHYCSSGPSIESFTVKDGVAEITCSAATEIRFVAQGSLGRLIKASPGEPLTTARWKLHDRCKFVRVKVTDQDNRHAWTNPIILDQKP